MIFVNLGYDEWNYLCGGSIIREEFILTAAHCLTNRTRTAQDPQLFRIVVGAISTTYKSNKESHGAYIFDASYKITCTYS